VTDVAVDVLSSVAPTKRKRLDTGYAMAVSRRAKISPCTLMMGILYSERLRQKNPEYLSRVSSSDLFLISMMVASKYLYDEGEDEEVFNDDWAKAGNRTVNDVNKLEMEFVASIDWSLFISNEDFMDFVNKVESRVAATHGLCRGWFTYGDLCTLLDNSGFLHTLGIFRIEMLKVLCACAVAYLLSLSLALSLTTLASRHHHHTHQRFTLGHPTPSFTTKTAGRFHQPALINVQLPQWQGANNSVMAQKEDQGMHSKSWMSVQGKPSLSEYALKEGADQSKEINTRLTPEKNKAVSQPFSGWRLMSNKSNVPTLTKVTTCKWTPGLPSRPTLLSDISSRKLVFEEFLLSSISRNSHVTSLVQNDFVLTNFSRGSGNNHNHLFTNQSYICVA